jgi:nicotinate-nucleotide adenylyltransferase
MIKSKMIKIGIMGGTFNPIHMGHLVTASEALNQFDLDRILFVPSGLPPHKEDVEKASSEHRYLMTVIAAASNENFFVSRIEIDSKKISYTLDTLRQLKKLYGPDSEFFFITGADAILEILTWKKPQEVIKLCSFIAATRPGYDLSKLTELRSKLFKDSRDGADKKIFVVDIPALAISSTDIRARIKDERPIDYLVPEGVASYIIKHGLYK